MHYDYITKYSCEDIDGTSRLYEDLEVKCYKSTHTLFSFAIAMPALILWGNHLNANNKFRPRDTYFCFDLNLSTQKGT